jgi:uncharacterized membrane protein YfcA
VAAYAFYSFLEPRFGIKKTRINAAVGGSLSGFLAGLIGLGGAVRGAFLVAFDLPKEVYVATSAEIVFVIDVTRIPTYVLTKTIQSSTSYILLPFLCVMAYLGTAAGKRFLERIDQRTFRRAVSIALLAAGAKILFL